MASTNLSESTAPFSMAEIPPVPFTTRDGRVYTIRTAKPEDAAAISQTIRREYFSDPNALKTHAEMVATSIEERAQRLRESLESPVHLWLVAEFESDVVGSIVFKGHAMRRLAHLGELGISVDDAHRGRGIGRALLIALLEWAREHPTIERVDLGVFHTNLGARRLYRSVGFRRFARLPRQFRLADDRYVDDIKMTIWVKPGLAPAGFRTYAAGTASSHGDTWADRPKGASRVDARARQRLRVSHSFPGVQTMPAPAPLKDPRFTGSFTAIVTPFSADGSKIDWAKLDEHIAFQAKGNEGAGGVRGIVICGTTGESPTLEESEYRELVERGIASAKKHKLLAIVGTGSNSTHHAQHLSKIAKAAGADGSLSVNPYYNKPTQEGLYRHFMTLADTTDLPIMLYNIPGRTGVALTPATVQRLNAHPKIVANKEATGSTDSASEIAMRCPGLALLSGDDSMTLPFAAVGGVGVVSVVSNILPTKVANLCHAFLKGQWDIALNYHRDLFDVCRAMFVETNPIPIKAAMKLLGRDTGSLRLPMSEAAPATVDGVRKALTQAGLL